MPTLIANRQLVGDWGNTPPNGMFETDEETALSLESRGLATRWKPPQRKAFTPDNKMLPPLENKSA